MAMTALTKKAFNCGGLLTFSEVQSMIIMAGRGDLKTDIVLEK